MAHQAPSTLVHDDRTKAVGALRGLLDDMASVVAALDEGAFTARPVPGASGSIGEHVRHCLDHIASLLAARPSAPLSYDHRERGMTIERDPAEALRWIMRLKAALDRWPTCSLEQPILFQAKTATSAAPTATFSTLGRELAFVLSHTIHHQALIRVLLELVGQAAPERFGYASSTPSRA